MPVDPSSTGIPSFFIVIVVVIAVIGAGSGIWRFIVLRSGGLNPVVAREQLEAKLNQSQMMAPPKTIEQRLAELDDLHNRGVITDAEHAEARAKALTAG
jgi:hypothetical protein